MPEISTNIMTDEPVFSWECGMQGWIATSQLPKNTLNQMVPAVLSEYYYKTIWFELQFVTNIYNSVMSFAQGQEGPFGPKGPRGLQVSLFNSSDSPRAHWLCLNCISFGFQWYGGSLTRSDFPFFFQKLLEGDPVWTAEGVQGGGQVR